MSASCGVALDPIEGSSVVQNRHDFQLEYASGSLCWYYFWRLPATPSTQISLLPLAHLHPQPEALDRRGSQFSTTFLSCILFSSYSWPVPSAWLLLSVGCVSLIVAKFLAMMSMSSAKPSSSTDCENRPFRVNTRSLHYHFQYDVKKRTRLIITFS